MGNLRDDFCLLMERVWLLPSIVLSDLIFIRRVLPAPELKRYIGACLACALLIGLVAPGYLILIGYPITGGSRPSRCLRISKTSHKYLTRLPDRVLAWIIHRDASASNLELRDDRRDVVVLFLKAELPNTVHDCGQQSLARQVPMLLQRFNQAPLAKFLSLLVTGFGDAIRVGASTSPGKSSAPSVSSNSTL